LQLSKITPGRARSRVNKEDVMFKSIGDWLSRWTWKKVWKVTKKISVSVIIEMLKELREAVEKDKTKEETLALIDHKIDVLSS